MVPGAWRGRAPLQAGFQGKRQPRQLLHSLCAESVQKAGGSPGTAAGRPAPGGLRLGRTPEEAEGLLAPRTHHHARGRSSSFLEPSLTGASFIKGVIPFHLMTIPTGSARDDAVQMKYLTRNSAEII